MVSILNSGHAGLTNQDRQALELAISNSCKCVFIEVTSKNHKCRPESTHSGKRYCSIACNAIAKSYRCHDLATIEHACSHSFFLNANREDQLCSNP